MSSELPFKRAELQICYKWTCDECAEVNYVEPMLAEFTEESAEQAYRKFNDLDEWSPLPDDWRDFELCKIPQAVTRKIDEEKA